MADEPKTPSGQGKKTTAKPRKARSSSSSRVTGASPQRRGASGRFEASSGSKEPVAGNRRNVGGDDSNVVSIEKRVKERQQKTLDKSRVAKTAKKKLDKQTWGAYQEAIANLGFARGGANSVSSAELLQMLLRRVSILWASAAAKADQLDIDGITPGVSVIGGEHGIPLELIPSENVWSFKVDREGNAVVTKNHWVILEESLRVELVDLCDKMERLGIAERLVRTQEAQVELIGQALRAACERIGLTHEQQRQLGQGLREELAVLEGTAA